MTIKRSNQILLFIHKKNNTVYCGCCYFRIPSSLDGDCPKIQDSTCADLREVTFDNTIHSVICTINGICYGKNYGCKSQCNSCIISNVIKSYH